MADGCEKGSVTRRSLLAGGIAAAASTAVSHPVAADRGEGKQPETRVLDDPRVRHGSVAFRHNGRETGIGGYLAQPRAAGAYPAVLVIAGNKISEEYIPNTCAALALAGFVGLAPDVFHPLPESARTPEEYDRFLASHTEMDRLDDIQVGRQPTCAPSPSSAPAAWAFLASAGADARRCSSRTARARSPRSLPSTPPR
jgi:hypothetical protein